MSIAIITGSTGLIGSEAARHFARQGLRVIGIDNDMRARFFGEEASTRWQRRLLEDQLGDRYEHHDIDIRDAEGLSRLFARFGNDVSVVVHAAAQPSHDWAARDPQTDFSVNATGTLNVLEAARAHAPEAPFIFTSTNKVYGDSPNNLPLVEQATRWELDPDHPWSQGIPEDMSIDQSLHSLFGASKAAADLLVQEYGRYFGMPTVCFRGGCLTGPNHSGAELHGFLSYLVRCAITDSAYTVYGYGGKQVRDNIHSSDLVNAFDCFFRNPRCGEVYNIGGGRSSNCSMLEAIGMCETLTGRPMRREYSDEARRGDHIWYISDTSRFESHYPDWSQAYTIDSTLRELYESGLERHLQTGAV